jgi:acyl-CoA synthetase (AMP-forming)/AMP-acid ligase II
MHRAEGESANKHWLRERLRGWGDRPAMIGRGEAWSFARLSSTIDEMLALLARHPVPPGSTLAICGDYSPQICALLLAAVFQRLVVVPIASAPLLTRKERLASAEVMFLASFDERGLCRISDCGYLSRHPLLQELIDREAPGLVLFSSGSTGKSKASLLDLDRLLAKFREERPGQRTLVFLMIDHIGGINTLFHVLCHGGTIVSADDRSPNSVCSAIATYGVELLPTTPTFLNMLLISDALSGFALSSLRTITYGTEPMPASTLAALREALPGVRLKQTYGLTELGILPTQSRSSDSVWLKLGTRGFEHKIIDNVLWLRSETAMLGYLNAASPFDSEGWFNTQDLVSVDGDYIRILGRTSEVINVGGEKVYPTEVESLLLQLDNVQDVTVSGRPNPVTGAVVAARFSLADPEDLVSFQRRVRAFCLGRLERFKMPIIIEIAAEAQHSARFKKRRIQDTG